MKTEVTQIIRLTIKGQTFEITAEEAKDLRNALNGIVAPDSSPQVDWSKEYKKLHQGIPRRHPDVPYFGPQGVPNDPFYRDRIMCLTGSFS